jgi:hypothetical protein
MVQNGGVAGAKDVVGSWGALSREELADEVDHLVKNRDARAREVWALVRRDQVLAARVRGVLAGLRSEARGTRDEAMRLVWINQASQALNAPEPVEARPAAAAKPVAKPEVEPEIVLSPPPQTAPRQASAVPAVFFQAP